jgi:hypothetical protein
VANICPIGSSEPQTASLFIIIVRVVAINIFTSYDFGEDEREMSNGFKMTKPTYVIYLPHSVDREVSASAEVDFREVMGARDTIQILLKLLQRFQYIGGAAFLQRNGVIHSHSIPNHGTFLYCFIILCCCRFFCYFHRKNC